MDEPILMDFIAAEAEQGLLGILLVAPQKIHDITGLITSEDFAYEINGDIFTKISEMITNDKKVSPVTLKPWFENRKDAPNSMYLAELAGAVISTLNCVSYAETIHASAEKRRFLDLLDEMKLKAFDDPDVSDLKLELSTRLENTSASVFVKTKQQVLIEVAESLKDSTEFYDIGIPRISKAMGGGLYAGFTYGFAGAEKSGKTTIAQTISYNLNETGVDHAYIALEMGSKQIEQRNVARSIGVNSLAFLGENKAGLIHPVADHTCKTNNNTLYLDMAGCSFNQIKAEIIKLVTQKKIRGFILDYWQLISGCEPRQSNSDFLFSIAQWCAGYCRRNGVWCIILSQLNRDGKLLGSAGIERACDQLYVLKASENELKEGIYITLTHSRYTPTIQMGNIQDPAFFINKKVGPYLDEY